MSTNAELPPPPEIPERIFADDDRRFAVADPDGRFFIHVIAKVNDFLIILNNASERLIVQQNECENRIYVWR